ncbi:putative membrane protein [Mycobacterium avium subsp. avium 2285 (R)]|nr:putative membrane protein [Mycobacterium avium subsp. avium 2285 (R)]
MLSLALFVLNVCTHGTMLGLIGTGGLAVVMGYNAYRAWFGKRRTSQQ